MRFLQTLFLASKSSKETLGSYLLPENYPFYVSISGKSTGKSLEVCKDMGIVGGILVAYMESAPVLSNEVVLCYLSVAFVTELSAT